MDKYDVLKLENQLCFPLYAVSKEIVRKYKPFLDEIDLTYTQYICMMAMWEHENMNVKELGEYLYLDSGTLTPLLKKLEEKEYIKRTRSKNDERNLIVKLTDKGKKLRDEAISIPTKMACSLNLSIDEVKVLKKLLNNLLNNLENNVDK